MKIDSIHVENFLGVRRASLDTRAPVNLIAGSNGAGKSSIRDAVALALSGDLTRVHLKKDAGQLVREDTSSALISLHTADGDTYGCSITAAGKITDIRGGRMGGKGPHADTVLQYVLDAQRFARLDPNERRLFLFGLMGLKTDGPAIVERLGKREIDKDRIQRIAPLLRAGFDPAHKEAKNQATQAKGAWRAVTGETYGSEKAKTWTASVPPYDAAAAKTLATELQHCDVALESWQQSVGKLQAEATRRADLRKKLPALQEHAAKVERIADKLARDQQSLADWEADLVKTAAAAGTGPREGLVHTMGAAIARALPAWPSEEHNAAGWQALRDALDAYEAEHGAVGATAGDSKAAARLPTVRNSRDLMASAVVNDQRDLAAAQQAKAEADAIAGELAEVFDAAALESAAEQITTLKAQRAAIVQKLDALKTVKAAVDSAEAKTLQARTHADDVAGWDLLADALAPDGIPGEILAEALGPMNERLASSAVDTNWPRVEVCPDMSVREALHERPYALLSESEQWRADAMLAEAIAHLSGAQLLVLDRFDVLDLTGRGDLLAWLDVLAETGELATALVFGTLKALPANLPETIAAHWLDAGTCGQLKEAA